MKQNATLVIGPSIFGSANKILFRVCQIIHKLFIVRTQRSAIKIKVGRSRIWPIPQKCERKESLVVMYCQASPMVDITIQRRKRWAAMDLPKEKPAMIAICTTNRRICQKGIFQMVLAFLVRSIGEAHVNPLDKIVVVSSFI